MNLEPNTPVPLQQRRYAVAIQSCSRCGVICLTEAPFGACPDCIKVLWKELEEMF